MSEPLKKVQPNVLGGRNPPSEPLKNGVLNGKPLYPYSPEYYRTHKKQYNQSSKTYYSENKQKFKDRYIKSKGYGVLKGVPPLIIKYFPEGVNPFE